MSESTPNITTRQLSPILGVCESTLRGWRCAEVGPVWFKLRGAVRYRMADVEKFIHEGKRIPSVRAHMEEDLVSVQTER